MTDQVVAVVIAAEPILRGGYGVLVTDAETGECYLRLARVGDPRPELEPPAVLAYRERRLNGPGELSAEGL